MADVSKRLLKGVLDTATTNNYTVPQNKYTIFKSITVSNTSSSVDLFLTIRLAGISIISGHKIKANDTLHIPYLDQIMHAGDSLNIYASVVSGTLSGCYYISGREVDV
ncbi:hypothetical protein [Paenibacillus chibensis]|uniref:hypothetical protein n=1 Tax=Paenibacillus chibensis TaxID=59846 RepID=UPI000FDA4AA1|nr:hypothetical protein [Paenibacillus chibensis]MEC0370896.1 hypothetical protein [Paenibacillus chibensis]